MRRARKAGRTSLLESEARDLLACYGVQVPSTVLVRDAKDAVNIVSRLGEGPLALKVVSKDVLHKSDAGGVEAVFTALAMHHQIAPPTINLVNPDPQCDLDYVPNTARKMRIKTAVSNSFGFGGTNGSLVFRTA